LEISVAFGKQVRMAFKDALRKTMSDYEVVPFPIRGRPDFILRHKENNDLFLFVLVVMFPAERAFTLELRWSNGPGFPLDAPARSPLDGSGEPIQERIAAPKGQVRIGRLLGFNTDRKWQSSGRTLLDQFVDLTEALSQGDDKRADANAHEVQKLDKSEIEKLVDDAINVFKANGVPFFERVRKARSGTR
jgi:hypothetical protein